jgi:hypothetical protein
MRRLLLFAFTVALALSAATLARAASPVLVSPDVPTDETASATTILPWQISEYDAAGPGYTLTFTVPGDPILDAIEKMDTPGDWLFSVEAASDLGASLTTFAEPRDVIRYDDSTGSYLFFFCGDSVLDPVPSTSNVDAIYLEGGDGGNLVVSFDVVTTIGGSTFDPADLVRYGPTGGGTCASWKLAAVPLAFDASAAGTGVPLTGNVIGADSSADLVVLAFDVPTDLGPPGVTTYLPGELVSWDGASYALYESLVGWPISSQVDGVSCPANPGIVPTTILMGKSVTPGDLTITWSASCSEGGTDYGIYQGTIGTWYDHASIDCSDAGGDLTEDITPAAASSYYLVVAHNTREEGSYGVASSLVERPVGFGGGVCAPDQVVTPCPVP